MRTKAFSLSFAILACAVLSLPNDEALAGTRLLMGTGGLAGVYYPIGSAISKIITSKVPGVEATVQTSAAGMENLRLLSLKEIDMGLVQNSDAYNAFNGLVFFKDKPIKNIRGIAVLYPQPIQVVVRGDANIKTFYDLKGKRVGVGAPGSGEETTFRRLMSVYKLTYSDMDAKLISLAEQAAQFKDRHLDAMWYVSGVPASGILDVASVLSIRLVPITGKERDDLIKMDPTFIKSVVPKASYPGMTEDLETVASPAYLVCLDSLKEDDVYRMTKATFDNLKELASSHKQAENIKLETALIGSTIPLHPGAEKFYREKGLIK
jgi:uncharacterized protein